jgi:hypothetical protein
LPAGPARGLESRRGLFESPPRFSKIFFKLRSMTTMMTLPLFLKKLFLKKIIIEQYLLQEYHLNEIWPLSSIYN